MRPKLDKKAIQFFKTDMMFKYLDREDKDNIYGVGITDNEFRNYIISIILGEYWYVADPLGHDQINEEALCAILDKLNKNWRDL